MIESELFNGINARRHISRRKTQIFSFRVSRVGPLVFAHTMCVGAGPVSTEHLGVSGGRKSDQKVTWNLVFRGF